MKYNLEFVDRNKNPVILTKEERDAVLEKKINQAMELIGFRRKVTAR